MYLACPMVIRARNTCVYCGQSFHRRHLKSHAFFHLSTTSAPTVPFLSSYSPSLQLVMSDKQKVKGKPTGQQKSAGRDHNNDLAQDVVADKENSQTSSE